MNQQDSKKQEPKKITGWQYWIATGLGTGLAAYAPGTVASFCATLFIYIVALALGAYDQVLPIGWHLTVIVIMFWVGVKCSDYCVKQMKQEDPKQIVIDEYVGLWLCFLAIPITELTLLVGFSVFRLLDIIKPFPISWVEKRWVGGLGVMADDLLAGFFTWIVLFSFM